MHDDIEKHHPARRAGHSSSAGAIEEMERMFDEFMPRGWVNRWGWPSWGELTRPIERFAPRVNVLDRDEEVVVRAGIPGVRKEDLDISVSDATVTIKGHSERGYEDEKGTYYRCEIAAGDFARTVDLPCAVDNEKVQASFEDGLLELRMPKIRKTRRRHVRLV